MPSPRELKVDDEIRLCQLTINDAEILFTLVNSNREFLRKWLVWVDKTQSVDDSLGYIKTIVANYEERSIPTYKILYKDEACGVIGFNFINTLHNFAALGYWLAENFNGKGIMTRTCKALTKHAFEDLGLNKVEIGASVENSASRAIAERLGFKEEATLRHRELLANGQYADLVFYGMLKSEFKA